MITLLDYGAGNVRSVINAVENLGEQVRVAQSGDDLRYADKLIFPGVGAYGSMMARLQEKQFIEPLKAYLYSGRPFLGICLGLQALFESSEEAPGVQGLGVMSGTVKKFTVNLAVPHIGWNGLKFRQPSHLFKGLRGDEKFYFVHSYHVVPDDSALILTATDYGYEFASSIKQGNIVAVQFHPEKSGLQGLNILKNFLQSESAEVLPEIRLNSTGLAKRIIACLDVRADDQGRLLVTKGDQYEVREGGTVRDMGDPVEAALRYYQEGADEITFLNITGFRDFPLKDLPMLAVLRQTSNNVFVPLTVGGGIRDFTDKDGIHYTALETAAEYFRSGADKISISSDAVLIAENYLKTGHQTGSSAIETISAVYGSQAVVISIDPRRVYVQSPGDVPHQVIRTDIPGPSGEQYCWFQCTINGGRQNRPIDAITLARISQYMGAGEILLNCIDRDGTNLGYDMELINAVRSRISIPVIASSGAGTVEHFLEVFTQTKAESALAAGVFHRREITIGEVKHFLRSKVDIRQV